MNINLSKKMKKGAVFLLALAAALCLLLYYMFRIKSESSLIESREQPKYQVYAEQTIVPLTTSAMGTVAPHVSSVISAEISGQVKKTYAHQGQKVGKDDPLADIDPQTYDAELNRAIQLTQSLKAQLAQKKDLYERTDRLFKKDAATAIEWQRTYSGYLAALAEFEAAAANAETLAIRYDKTKIISPYEGIIGKKMVEEGDLVLPGSPTFLVYTIGDMDVEFFIPERYLPYMHKGDEVGAFIELGQVQTAATIYEIKPYEDPNTRTFLVKAHLNDYRSIVAGAFVAVHFNVGEKLAILIPSKSVERVGQLEMVRVLENSKWVRRYIRTGPQIDDEIEVVSGLSGGEVIGYD